MIDQRGNKRRGGSGKASRILHLKIRLSKKGTKPTREELFGVVDFIMREGHAPVDWKFHSIDWSHPGGGSKGSGGLSDLLKFRAAIEAMGDDLQFAIVRK